MGVGSLLVKNPFVWDADNASVLYSRWLVLFLRNRFAGVVDIDDVEAVFQWAENGDLLGSVIHTARKSYRTSHVVGAVLESIASAKGGGK